jgi:hypothetical protein
VLTPEAWEELVRLEVNPGPSRFQAGNEREAAARAAADSCTHDDVEYLVSDSQSSDPGVRTAALHVLLYLTAGQDHRLSREARQRLTSSVASIARRDYPEVQPRDEFPDRRASSLALQLWMELDPPQADVFADERTGFASSIATDSWLHFPVQGEKDLVLGPGTIPCRVRFEELPFDAGLDDSTVVLVRTDVTDAGGSPYRAHSLLSAQAFFELLRWSPLTSGEQPASPVTPRLRANVDYREHVPVCVPTLRGAEPIVLWGKHLSTDVVLRRCHEMGDWLAVHADPLYGRLGGGAIPGLDAAGPWAGRTALTSGITTFYARALATTMSWSSMAAGELQAAWTRARRLHWAWPRLLSHANPTLLENLVLDHEPETLTREAVWDHVDLIRNVGTPRALERLRLFGERQDFLGDHARQVRARLGLSRQERIVELFARRREAAPYSLRELLEMAPRPSQEDLLGWAGAPDTTTEDGSWRYHLANGDALDVAWTGESTMKFTRESFGPRPWPPPSPAAHRHAADVEAVVQLALPTSLSFELAGGGRVTLPRGRDLVLYVSFVRERAGLAATIHVAGPDGRSYVLRRHVDPQLLLALLMQFRTCLVEGAPSPSSAAMRLVDARLGWPRPTVLPGLVYQPEPDRHLVMESGFDIGGEVVAELWRVDAHGRHAVSCCLRQVARVDGEPPCDVTASLPALAKALVAPWLCQFDPTVTVERASWALSDRRLDAQPEVAVVSPH